MHAALQYMNSNNMDTLDKFAKVDMNRKSKEYSKAIFEFYLTIKRFLVLQ